MFEILRGGCNTRHPQSFFTDRPQGNPNWLLLVIKTPCVFRLLDVSHTLTAGTAIIIPPGTPYFYKNPNGEYMDDWMHFNFDVDSFDIESYVPSNQFFPVGDVDSFSFYIRQLLYENTYGHTECRKENIDYLMRILLNNLAVDAKNKGNSDLYNPYYPKLQQIRMELQSSIYQEKTADDYSTQLGISKSHFQHLYKNYFGIAFNQDIIQMRIAFAKDMLETSDMPVEQISEICGYTNDVHFFRQFHTITGLTPAKYRKHFRNKLL